MTDKSELKLAKGSRWGDGGCDIVEPRTCDDVEVVACDGWL